MNSAAFVLNFFLDRTDKVDAARCRYADLVEALADVDGALDAAANNGDEEAKLAVSSMSTLWTTLTHEYASRHDDFDHSVYTISTEAQMALRIAERILAAKVGEYSAERRASIKELVDSIPGALNELTLPEQLKLYVLRLAQEVDVALMEYEATSDFKLDVAFSRLQTSLNSIAVLPKSNDEQGKFLKFLSKKLTPCLMVLSMASGIGYNSLQSYQIYTQIGSSSQQTSVSQPPSGTHQTADGSETPDSHE